MRWVAHDAEGPDDMPAHIKAALTAVSLSIPVTNARPALGRRQGIYLFEHRDGAHARRVVAILRRSDGLCRVTSIDGRRHCREHCRCIAAKRSFC